MGVDVELFVDATDISVHGVRADFQAVCNLLFGVAVGKQVQHLALSFGQVRIQSSRTGLGLECARYKAGDATADWRTARLDQTQGCQKFRPGGSFEQIPDGASREGLKNGLRITVN